MSNALRAEWIKLRTVLMHWILVIIAVAFPLIVTLLTAFFNGDNDNQFDAFTANDLVQVLTGTSVVAGLLLAVMAAASITGEFGFNTIRPTLSAVPSRTRVAAAKAIVLLVVTAVVQGTVILVGAFVGKAVAEGRGSTIDFGERSSLVPALVGTVVLAMLLSLFGLGIGLLLRSTPGAISLIVLWPLLIESLVGGLLALATDNEDVVNWLPFRAGAQLTNTDIGGEFSGGGPSRIVGGIYFGAVAVALVVLGTMSLRRRDA